MEGMVSGAPALVTPAIAGMVVFGAPALVAPAIAVCLPPSVCRWLGGIALQRSSGRNERSASTSC
jgi:hypothetical protein